MDVWRHLKRLMKIEQQVLDDDIMLCEDVASSRHSISSPTDVT